MAFKIAKRTDEIWLLGKPISRFTGTKLPSRGECIRVIFYLHQTEPEIKQCFKSTAAMIFDIWDKAKIPTITPYRIIDKLSKLHQEYYHLRKSKNRTSGKAIENQKTFVESLENLFDIAHPDALHLMKIQEDKDFLLMQRNPGRPGSMIGTDTNWVKRETRKKKRLEEAQRRRDQWLEEQGPSTSGNIVNSSSSDENERPKFEKSLTFSRQKDKGSTSRPKAGISQQVASALDRTQISDRKAAHILLPFAAHLGHNVKDIAISPSSIRRKRIINRTLLATELKESFSPNVPLTLHWDGKLMSDLVGREKIERLPILVSGEGVEKILSVPKLNSGDADSVASEIGSVLAEWNVKDRIESLCFDTTAVNTGAKSGICMRIETLLERELLHLACRHHILEILLSAIFTALAMEPSKSADITLFLNFRDLWPKINKTKYKTAIEVMPHRIQPWRDNIIQFSQNLLRFQQPRDDYKEFLELTMIFLGFLPHERSSVSFRTPGAVHRARWMARAIYVLKIWLFQDEFSRLQPRRASSRISTDKHFWRKLGDLCIFITKYYLRAWFTAKDASMAARMDLALLKELASHEDPIIKEVGTKAMSRHLWYLSEVTVGLALFDDGITSTEKHKMVANINTVKGSSRPIPRLSADAANDAVSKELPDFFTSTTMKIFHHLDIDSFFLSLPTEEWNTSEAYKRGKERLKGLLVTNDAAERGVALVQEFTVKGRTKQEDQLQYMIQVAEEHRRAFPKTADKMKLQ